jgi:hypothetical protein
VRSILEDKYHDENFGNLSFCEDYIVLEIVAGNLTKEMHMKLGEYEAYKDRQFQVYKLTDLYAKAKRGLRRFGESQKNIDSYLRRYLIECTSAILPD